MRPCDPLLFTEGDTLPHLDMALGVDISGWQISLHVAYHPVPLVKIAEVTNAALGEFTVTWQSGDLLAGRHDAELQLVDVHGDIFTIPMPKLFVRKAIA